MRNRSSFRLRACRFVGATVAGAALLALPASSALAQQKAPITIGEVTIVGRVQKPVAAVDVSRIAPKLTLMELKQPFIERIEEATKRDPF
jgi:hypothetical protein